MSNRILSILATGICLLLLTLVSVAVGKDAAVSSGLEGMDTPSQPLKVLVDEAHDNQLTLSWARAQEIAGQHPGAQPSWYYLGRLQNILADEFILERNADSTLTGTLLKNYDALLVPIYYDGLTNGEVSAVHQFVTAGGGLIVLGDCGFNIPNPELVGRYGMTLDAHCLFAPVPQHEAAINIESLATHDAVSGVTQFIYNWGGSLDLSASAVGLAWTGADAWRDMNWNDTYDAGIDQTGAFAVAAATSTGCGRVVAVVDDSLGDEVLEWANTHVLMRALLPWVTGGQSCAGVSGCLPRYSEPQYVLGVGGSQEYEPWLASGDFDGDGLDDIVTMPSHGWTTETDEMNILLNDGNGSLVLGTATVFSGTVPRTAVSAAIPVVAELNGDGRSDIFVVDTGQDTDPFPGYQNTLVLSAPGGKLVDATANLPQFYDMAHEASAGDIDGDGDNDLFVGTNWGQNMIDPYILLNDGSGRFTLAEDRLHPSLDLEQNTYTASEFVDVNNDGYPDLVLGDLGDDLDNEYSTPDSVVLLNDGTGSFTSPPIALPPKPFGDYVQGLDIEAADLNHDGYEDMFVVYTWAYEGTWVYEGRYVQILINNQDGTFRDETDIRLPQSDSNRDAYVYQLHLWDVDRDQDLDLIARPYDLPDPSPLLYLNDGAGYFSREPLDFQVEYLYYSFLDLDGDGGHDIVNASASPPEDYFIIRELGCPVFLPFVCRNCSVGH
jgi:hypothetical protein